MEILKIPNHYNYIGVFLTLGCNLKCPYCINDFSTKSKYKLMCGDKWIEAINRIHTRPDLPVTLQGGEPTIHPAFYDIVAGIRKDINIDLLTNGQFNVDEFCKRIPPERMKRTAKYASIRFSYHRMTMDLSPIIEKVKLMQTRGYSVGIWIVDFPGDHTILKYCKALIEDAGIDCRMKEYLGFYKGKLYGTYKYPEAISGTSSTCLCKPSELLLAPNGDIHVCHANLYAGRDRVGNVNQKKIFPVVSARTCKTFGLCNPCDIKLKTNRFQMFGHCSVNIKKGL